MLGCFTGSLTKWLAPDKSLAACTIWNHASGKLEMTRQITILYGSSFSGERQKCEY